MNEADWKIHDVLASMRELEGVIEQGDADAEQVRRMAEDESS